MTDRKIELFYDEQELDSFLRALPDSRKDEPAKAFWAALGRLCLYAPHAFSGGVRIGLDLRSPDRAEMVATYLDSPGTRSFTLGAIMRDPVTWTFHS